MNSRRKNSRKIAKKPDIESKTIEQEEISREEAIELLMLNTEDRPTSPRHPKRSLDSEERVSIPNIDVELKTPGKDSTDENSETIKETSPSSPIVPPNRRRRPIVKRVPASSVGPSTAIEGDNSKEDAIPKGIPVRNITPEVYNRKISPILPVGLKPSPTGRAVPVNTPDRSGPSPGLIKPTTPTSHDIQPMINYDNKSPLPLIKSATPASHVRPVATPVNSAKESLHQASPFRAGPSPSVRSINTPTKDSLASSSPSVRSITTPARAGPSPSVRAITTPARAGPSPSVRSINTPAKESLASPTGIALASPATLVSPSVRPINTPAKVSPLIPVGIKPTLSTVQDIQDEQSSLSPSTPIQITPLQRNDKPSHGPKIVISTVPDDNDEQEEYSDQEEVGYTYTPGTAVPIRPFSTFTNTGTTSKTNPVRRTPEPAFIPLKKNKDGIPDYSVLDTVQQAAKWSEFEVKFNILRENNPTYLITLPDRNNETLEEVFVRHREYVKHIAKSEFVDECVEEYRAYLIIVWALIELLCSKMLLIPSAGGYFLFQLTRFKKYEGLLVQLGEQGWTESKGKSSSPLWSIIFSSVVTAVVFILVNFLLGSLGNGISREVSDKAIAFLLGERSEEEEGGLTDIIRQLTGGTGDLSSVIDTIRGMAGFFGGNFAQAAQ